MRRSRRSRSGAAAAVALALVTATAGCTAAGAGSGGSTAGPDTSFSYQLLEPADLIPGNTNETQGSTVDALLYSGLTGYDDRTGRSVNVVARSVTSPDRKVWTVKLRHGWTFHDGEKVTAQSFAGAWDATVANAWLNSYFFVDLLRIHGAKDVAAKHAQHMSGVQVVDPYTLRVTLDAPNSDFPLVLGYTGFFPMPASVLKSKNWKAYKLRPVGNGPYRMDGSWSHDRFIKVRRYADYAGPHKGRAEKITLKIYSNPETAYNDVIAGDLDIATVAPSRLSSAPKDFGDRYATAPSSQFTYLGFPLGDARFSDVRTRRALSMAIDRKQITKVLYNNTQTPAGSLVTPLIKLGHRDDPCGQNCHFDPEQAMKLLAEAGDLKPGDTITLWHDTGNGNEDWVEAVANQIRINLGLRVKIKGQPWATYLQTTQHRKVDGPFRLGWLMDYPSPYDYLGPLYGRGASSNNTGYSSDAFESALDKAAAARDPGAAVPYYHAAENRVLADMPVVPLWFGTTQTVRSQRVDHLTYDGLGVLKLDQVDVRTS